MLNYKKRHFEYEMHENHGGLDFKLHDDPGIKLSSVGQCLVFVFSWAHCDSTDLTLTVCELRAIFFVSSKFVYKFDCFRVMIHWISKEASTRT